MESVKKRGSLQLQDNENITLKPLSPEAKRALAEAAERRAEREAAEKALEEARRDETNGPKNIEPTRFGDWERKGIAYDF